MVDRVTGYPITSCGTLPAKLLERMRKAPVRSMLDKKAAQELYDQAKKCQTVNGGGLLLALRAYLTDGHQVYEGCDELWQVADHLASPGILQNCGEADPQATYQITRLETNAKEENETV